MAETTNPQPLEQSVTPHTRHKWLLPTLVIALAASLIAVAVLATLLANGRSDGATRTVSVTGEATLKAAPDEHVFYPSYNFTNSDKKAALEELTKKSDEVVAGLKKVGVTDKDIKTNSNGYDNPGPVYYDDASNIRKGDATYSLQLTVTVKGDALVQKVQDYLLTTSPSGGVSPQSQFSDAKRKELEAQARDKATQDARSKADQSAKNLGFKVDRVKTVSDGSGFGGIMPVEGKAALAFDSASSTAASPPQLAVQPGENDLSYSVTVVYEIK